MQNIETSERAKRELCSVIDDPNTYLESCSIQKLPTHVECKITLIQSDSPHEYTKPLRFGHVETFHECDARGNPISILRMDDGMFYRMLHFPANPRLQRRTVFFAGRYASIEVSSEGNNRSAPRVTKVKCGPFEIRWVQGKVTDFTYPPLFPKDKMENRFRSLPEDVDNFIVLAVHYIAALNLWKDKHERTPTEA